ncbi:MAG TPA: integrase core domain-containing protein [Chloroflexota bacterium]|nr:integrase core domain-containing protein [Chloroflexota bacterium]
MPREDRVPLEEQDVPVQLRPRAGGELRQLGGQDRQGELRSAGEARLGPLALREAQLMLQQQDLYGSGTSAPGVWFGYIGTPAGFPTSRPPRHRRLYTPPRPYLDGRGAAMEEEYYADRARLRELLCAHPDWSTAALARHLGRSETWVKKWRARLRAAPPGDDRVPASRSRARRHPPPAISPEVVDRILAIRDQPPGNLQRVPGPRAILYYLEQDAELREGGARLPRSTRTIWEILTRHGRIARRPPRAHEPLDRPPPLAAWQLDFKDVSTIPADPEGKRQHVVEALNCVDCGTSLVLGTQVRDDFTEETAIAAVAELLGIHGLPATITIDRDPRFVGSPGGRDFPAPFVKFLTCLGVEVEVCPPRRPDRNAFVERYHRTLDGECLQVERPTTLERARAVTATFRRHYNAESPNQALSCGNRPPQVAFPVLPARPSLPAQVDPDRWLRVIDGRPYVRKVRSNGTVTVEHDTYFVGRRLAGQYVVLAVDAAARALVVRHREQPVKQLALKGLQGGPLPYEDYLRLMQGAARARRRLVRRHSAPAA